jgi:hypothetical protein
MVARPRAIPIIPRSAANFYLFINNLYGKRNSVTAVTSECQIEAYGVTMVNEQIAMGSTTMTATLKFLSRITNQVFESQMQRAAQRICERQQYLVRRVA